jgi:hypothetical protein
MQNKKRIRSQNRIYSAEQKAIIKTIGTTRTSNKKRVILTDSLSTLMATERNGDTKNPKTRILRKISDEEGEIEGKQQRNERQKKQTRMDQRNRRNGKNELSHNYQDKIKIYNNHSQSYY